MTKLKEVYSQYFLGYLLFITGVFLSLLTCGFGFLYTLIKYTIRLDFLALLRNTNRYFLKMAVFIDQWGNITMKTLFDDLFLKKESNDRFGDEDETISSVLGKNEKTGTLTKAGETLRNILNFLDDNHCINSIEYLREVGSRKHTRIQSAYEIAQQLKAEGDSVEKIARITGISVEEIENMPNPN